MAVAAPACGISCSSRLTARLSLFGSAAASWPTIGRHSLAHSHSLSLTLSPRWHWRPANRLIEFAECVACVAGHEQGERMEQSRAATGRRRGGVCKRGLFSNACNLDCLHLVAFTYAPPPPLALPFHNYFLYFATNSFAASKRGLLCHAFNSKCQQLGYYPLSLFFATFHTILFSNFTPLLSSSESSLVMPEIRNACILSLLSFALSLSLSY